MSIFSFISDIFSPASKMIDDLHTSEEEKLTLRNEFASIQEKANSKFIELEKAKIDALSKIQIAESTSKNWLQSSWRPLSSLALVGIIILGSFGIVKVGPDIYELAKAFLGIYAGGRTIEKAAAVIKLGK